MLLFYCPSCVIFQRVDATHNPYLHNLISVQPPRSTRSSSLVTLARPPTSSSFISVCLTLSLESTPYSSLRQPHPSLSVSDSPFPAPTTSSHSVDSPISPSITPSLFHSRLKTYLFHKSFPPYSIPASGLTRFIFVFSFLHYSFCVFWSVRQINLATRQLWTHENIVHCMILYLPHDSTTGGSAFWHRQSLVFVCLWNISGTAERICDKFIRKTCWSVARTNLKVKVKDQRSRSPGTKTAFSGPCGGLRAVCVW